MDSGGIVQKNGFTGRFERKIDLSKTYVFEMVATATSCTIKFSSSSSFSFSSEKDRRTDSRIRRNNTMGSIPGGTALFFRLIRLSVLLSLSELKEKRI